MKRETIFSPCRRWRYTLWREWDDGFWGLADDRKNAKGFVQFVGLNPSTADEKTNDPTVSRCIDFARRWGFGGMMMTNVFGFRATNPRDMKADAYPVGEDADFFLEEVAKEAGLIVAAWGSLNNFPRDKRNRAGNVLTMLRAIRPVHCLGTNKDGTPKHPLYLRADLKPILYQP